MRRFVLIGSLMLVVLPSIVAAQFDENAPVSRLAFVSERDGNQEIYVMDADGSGQLNLTNNPAADWHPVWSPDGTRIAFTSMRDGNEEIYVMNADGSGVVNLTNRPGPDNSPTWSPDGTRIAFASERDDWDIYVMGANGSNVTALTNDGQVKSDPAWSPDGNLVAYWMQTGGQSEIFTVNVSSGTTNRLTRNGTNDGWPRWSSDGLIMFDSFRSGNWDIYVMNADGSNPVNLTRNAAIDGRPSWSDWERRIAFGSDRDGDSEIYTLIVDSTGLRQLTENDAPDHSPSWQPNPAYSGRIQHVTAHVQFSYTDVRFTVENRTDDSWMFLTGVGLMLDDGATLTLDDLSGYGLPSVERLGPGECLFLRHDDADQDRPPRSCTVVGQGTMPVSDAFWQDGFDVESQTNGETHTCLPPTDGALTLCMMPR